MEMISKNLGKLEEFIDNWTGIELFSTGAEVVNFTGELYNVDGSSDDPNINGLSWKQLLLENGINGNCYVTNVAPPSDTSHPNFSVGGHMTVNRDGSVVTGGVCYLMPLCSWHNSKSRDKIAFEHEDTLMIKLSGYMENEPAATFMARQPSNEEFSLVSLNPNSTLNEGQFTSSRGNQRDELLQSFSSGDEGQHFILFRKITKSEKIYYVIEDAKLPK